MLNRREVISALLSVGASAGVLPRKAKSALLSYGPPMVGAIYYVSPSGSNSNSGLSPSAPWQTLAHVNAQTFNAGDTVLLQGGQTFSGQISLTTSNYSGTPPTSAHPLTIGTYSGGIATIAPTGEDAILLTNIGNITINNLILTGDGSANNNGVNINVTSGSPANIILNELSVSGFGRCGVLMATPNTVNSLSNVTVENCVVSSCTSNITITDNLTAGILCGINSSIGTTSVSGGTFVSTLALSDITVSNCTVENCPGSASTPSPYQSSTGILLTNASTPFVTLCYVANNGLDEVQGNAGIEYNWCAGGTVQFSEVYNQISASAPGDGDGIDFDAGCTNCVAQYNYIHHCGGSGVTFFNWAPFTHSGCVVRFNILENNSQSHSNYPEIYVSSFASGTAITGVAIYNNTVYNNVITSLVGCISDMGGVSGHFCNNIIMCGTASQMGINFANVSSFVANGNYYYSTDHSYEWDWNGTNYTTLSSYQSGSSQEANSVADTNPNLANPGNGGITNGYAPPAPVAYNLQSGSPCIGAGLNLNSLYSINPGTQDYYGNTVPNGVGTGYNVGAYGGAI